MKSIIIAAGSGKRIPEFSKKIPKSLITINNKSILKRQIDLMKIAKINQIGIIKGFKSNKINFKKIKYFHNKNFKKNEQLDSFFTAQKWFTDDLLIAFSDIIYEISVIEKIIKSKHDFTIAVQKNWKKKYKDRFDHPTSQADKVYIKGDKIIDIGKNLSEKKANGEFLGIFKVSRNICNKLINEYSLLKKNKNTNKLQMHDFFRYLIKKNVSIMPTYVNGKYMEIDTYNDFIIAKKLFNEN
jgi:L-glutamine-phosphate cytidylyltransferase